ncbi:type VI secretion system-associated protein TagF [Mesorhizobium sp.]|uniref:type VI secretion system-associated protein TagF n=1 Tax=Mesorhizobium sp. TaxID=1871066 RepID=UPI000FE69E10|nr:type VI secretion system-associated protein TagF [Mesorhizobium sp.]RWK62199.1 MAG: type VI secretion system-associated protein TagF [Mesorhizobium sp.]RWM48907.1 MAG: type VI secretion system-associated protein TagF [Mesorhizobium sp.]RWM54499.1 MAG: type VI secretion system-associated protein TagF [Mesorhizobium sp.]RWM61721.1 MAG: type VI secretion system-associated protein TagF [Mesorhizobium sp.]RWN03109.1 MAG: type VI secretion system-associated protein TagF [Mesorhizobium sp.]
MSATDMSTGFFGKIPATGDFVAANLPRTFIDRWDRWMSMELRERPDEGKLNSRVWRFIVKGGIFGDQPCAGAWRMSEDRVGRRYPFAIVRLGPPPEPGDPWYDAVASLLQNCVDNSWAQTRLAESLQILPPPGAAAATDKIAFWSDDWEVREFGFADIHDLAQNALPAMRGTAGDGGVLSHG